jgi:hypothetical protein
MRLLPLVACVVIVVFGAAPAFAKKTTLTASGQAVVAAGGKQLARSQAINAALRSAVGTVVAQLGGPGEGDDDTIDKNVYQRAAAYIPSSTVITENQDGSIFTVEVTVDVEKDLVLAALGGRRGAKQLRAQFANGGDALAGKRVIILATEQLGPNHLIAWTDYVWHWGVGGSSKTTVMQEDKTMGGIEAVMSDGFTNAGFKVVDPQVLKGKLAPRPAFRTLDLSTGDARNIAEKGDADFVVVVKGVAKDAHHATIAAGGMHSGQGNVVARLVRVRDGKVLASSTQHAAQVHIDLDTARLNALNEAARMAATELTQKINAN